MSFKCLMAHNIPLYNTVISKWVTKGRKVREGRRKEKYGGREKEAFLFVIGGLQGGGSNIFISH